MWLEESKNWSVEHYKLRAYTEGWVDVSRLVQPWTGGPDGSIVGFPPTPAGWLQNRHCLASSATLQFALEVPSCGGGARFAGNKPHWEGKMRLEIVTHCWNYSRLLTYQLSSLVLYPPSQLSVRMTVFHNHEDARTSKVLGFFGGIAVPNVEWHWWQVQKGLLFRRAIGRNMAALESRADWVWFTDCDQVFHKTCLDALPDQLAEQTAHLVFPKYVACSEHLDMESPLIQATSGPPRVIDINPAEFTLKLQDRAIGALQIARGETVRATGYCKDIPRFMRPASRFHRTREDVAFRRFMGTPGEPIDLPGLYRIEHRPKGRRWFWPATDL
ncbi:MAG: hypothetical protein RBS80_18975 [Thermoguttaceae bacterium]|nr:hypothetical protein [Thermoguttaceae bacterium]